MKNLINWQNRHFMLCQLENKNSIKQELIMELNDQNIEICVFHVTKQKGKGPKLYGKYILIYSGVGNKIKES